MTEEKKRNTRPLPRQGWAQRLSNRQTMIGLIIVSLILIVISALAGWLLLKNQFGLGSKSPPITLAPSLTEIIDQYPELETILSDPKLDSVYKEFLVTYQQGGPEAAYELAKKRGLLNKDDEVVLTLELDTTDTDALKVELEANGIKVTATSENFMDIAIPLAVLEQSLDSDKPGSLLESITGIDHIIRIRMPIPSLETGMLLQEVTTESLEVIGVYNWHNQGFTGKGIKIGILDKGFDRYKSYLGVELPENVVTQSFIAGAEVDGTGTVHGTAVAEIIHEIAPDAELFLAPYGTNVEMSQAVDWLLSQGVNIISNSTGSIYGPRDGSGLTAQIVEKANNEGVLWVNSSGNHRQRHYRATFTDTDNDGYHEYKPGNEMMEFYTRAGEWMPLALNWDDWKNGDQDYDLYVLDANGKEIAGSTNNQTGPGSDAAEGIIYQFEKDGPYYVAIYAKNVTRPGTLDFYIWGGEIEFPSYEFSLLAPGDAQSSFTVGATYWADDALEEYSSEGPTWDGRLKPEVVAPSRVSSAVYGETGEYFDGTSAAAPHVSGAAALVMQAFPNFTPQQVRDYLTNRSVDLGNGGADNVYGYGRLSLGEPPSNDEQAQSTEVAVVIPPTRTPEPLSTSVEGKKATPTRKPTQSASSSPFSSEGEASGALIFLLCVAFPAILGMGGVGLVWSVWYMSRPRKPAKEWSPVAQVPDQELPVYYQEQTALPALSDAQIIRENPCPRCGASNRRQARFCVTCGLDLKHGEPHAEKTPTFCAYCGTLLRSNSKFCSSCGKKVRSMDDLSGN